MSIFDTVVFYYENVRNFWKNKGVDIMATHSQIRAEQRYGLSEFKPIEVLKEIMADRCIQISESFEKFSRIFYVRYNNKYLKVVTDYNVSFVKTVLPDAVDFSLLEKLIEKLSNPAPLAA